MEPEIRNWTESHMEIKLNFHSPLSLSRTAGGSPPDYVFLEILDIAYFVSKETQIQMKQSEAISGYAVLIPKQLPDGISAEDIEDKANK